MEKNALYYKEFKQKAKKKILIHFKITHPSIYHFYILKEMDRERKYNKDLLLQEMIL